MSKEFRIKAHPVRLPATWRVLVGTIWLTTLCFIGCSDEDRAMDSLTSSTGGRGGTEATAQGGQGLGGDTALTDGPVPGQLTRNANGTLSLPMINTEGVYQLSCAGTDPILVEKDPPENAVPRIRQGEGAFYLDGEFYENERWNLGCDEFDCSPFSSEQLFAPTGVIQIGEKAAPAMGGAGGEGPDVPNLETYTRNAPFIFTNRYYKDPDCSGPLTTAKPVIISSIVESD